MFWMEIRMYDLDPDLGKHKKNKSEMYFLSLDAFPAGFEAYGRSFWYMEAKN